MMEHRKDNNPGGVLACSLGDFTDDDRVKVTIKNREIVIFKRKDEFYAMDTYCFHQGGPLHGGDIEDIDGRPCVKCPKHRYRICIENGERFMEVHGETEPTWQSKGIRQRTHSVQVRDGNIYIELSGFTKTFDSDKYNNGDKK